MENRAEKSSGRDFVRRHGKIYFRNMFNTSW